MRSYIALSLLLSQRRTRPLLLSSLRCCLNVFHRLSKRYNISRLNYYRIKASSFSQPSLLFSRFHPILSSLTPKQLSSFMMMFFVLYYSFPARRSPLCRSSTLSSLLYRRVYLAASPSLSLSHPRTYFHSHCIINIDICMMYTYIVSILSVLKHAACGKTSTSSLLLLFYHHFFTFNPRAVPASLAPSAPFYRGLFNFLACVG